MNKLYEFYIFVIFRWYVLALRLSSNEFSDQYQCWQVRALRNLQPELCSNVALHPVRRNTIAHIYNYHRG